MDPVLIPTAEIARFVVVLFRVGGVMVFAPFFSSAAIPTQVRVVFALVASVALAPCLPMGQVQWESGAFPLLTLLLGEALIGMIIGLVSLFLFAGMQLAGQIISFQLGFAIINVIDPQSEVEMTVFSFIENYVGLLFFLLINGHHWFLIAVGDSFNYLPVSGLHLNGPFVAEIVGLSSQMLVSGVQIAAPVIAVTIITDVVLAIVGRAAPQINIFIVGMPAKTLVGFVSMSISFYFLPHYLSYQFAAMYREISGLLHKLI